MSHGSAVVVVIFELMVFIVIYHDTQDVECVLAVAEEREKVLPMSANTPGLLGRCVPRR